MREIPYKLIMDREGHEPCPGVRYEENIVLREVDGWRQSANLFAPDHESAGPSPALLYFHGGGFTDGHPNAASRVGKTLAVAHGVKTFSVTYSLGRPERPSYPRPIEDAAFAWQWLQANAAAWNIDPHRIAVGGCSAGACVAAMALTRGRFPGAMAYLNYWGPLDFIARWYDRGQTPGAELNMLGQTYEQNPTLYHEASPLSHVRHGVPPGFFVFGRQDGVVHAHQGELGFAAWKAVGAYAELHILDEIGHVAGPENATNVRAFLDRSVSFVGRILQS